MNITASNATALAITRISSVKTVNVNNPIVTAQKTQGFAPAPEVSAGRPPIISRPDPKVTSTPSGGLTGAGEDLANPPIVSHPKPGVSATAGDSVSAADVADTKKPTFAELMTMLDNLQRIAKFSKDHPIPQDSRAERFNSKFQEILEQFKSAYSAFMNDGSSLNKNSTDLGMKGLNVLSQISSKSSFSVLEGIEAKLRQQNGVLRVGASPSRTLSGGALAGGGNVNLADPKIAPSGVVLNGDGKGVFTGPLLDVVV